MGLCRFTLKLTVGCVKVVLSPAFLNLYINRLILDMRLCSCGCHVNNCFICCMCYAKFNDILLLSASVCGLQELLNVCDQSVSEV